MARDPSAALAVSSKAARTASSAATYPRLICKVEVAGRDWRDAGFGGNFDLLCQFDKLTRREAARSIEVVMDQFRALRSPRLGKPLGGGNQAADFATAGARPVGGMEFRMANGVDRFRGQHQRPRNCGAVARNRRAKPSRRRMSPRAIWA